MLHKNVIPEGLQQTLALESQISHNLNNLNHLMYGSSAFYNKVHTFYPKPAGVDTSHVAKASRSMNRGRGFQNIAAAAFRFQIF